MNCYRLDLSNSVSGLPEGWIFNGFNNPGAPSITVKRDDEGPYLSLSGGGDPWGSAYISTRIALEPGAYRYETRFSLSADVNPQRNLLFQCRGDFHDGIFKFYRLEGGMAEGRDTLCISGEKGEAELRIYYRFNSAGEVKLRSLNLSPAETPKPRWARFACTSGELDRTRMAAVAAQAAADKADLLLYPEHVSQKSGDASEGDALLDLLGELAAKYGIYTAASVLVTDRADGRKYNRGVLYDRRGALAGIYDKVHPYSPEVTDHNVTPGTKTETFKTDFGRLGMIICYDSWFTDVTELLALKGAELILFPAAGYYRSLIPARAADNQVRFVISVLNKSNGCGIFDTMGRDVQNPEKDPTVRKPGGSSGDTFRDVRTFDTEGIGVLCASLDLNCSPSPHYNGGRMNEAPGGKRNRSEQVLYLDDPIKKEKERWWEID
jgi:predicted amidohydrolase